MTNLLPKFALASISRSWTVVTLAGLSAALFSGVRPPAAHPAVNPVEVATIEQPKEEPSFNVAEPAPTVELLHDATPEAADTSEAVIASAKVSASVKHARTMWMQVTAYCPCKKCCGPGAKGLTASGLSIRYNGGHFVAADTRLLHFHQKLVIPGYAEDQPVEVIDRGGAIKGHHVDVFFPTHEQAKAWGVRWMKVSLVDAE